MDDILKEFLIESHESLDRLDSDFVALEETPNDLDRLASIFRTVHTIKGTSGFLAFPTLERVAHVGENLLVPLRDGDLQLDHDIADALLAMVDAIRQILGNIESGGAEGDGDYSRLVGRLEDLKTPGKASQSPTPEMNSEDSNPMDEEATSEAPAVEPNDVEADAAVADEVAEPNEPLATPAETKSATPAPSPKQKKQKDPSNEKSSSLADSTVRIDVGLLDKLMNQVGELVLARNQILQFSSSIDDVTIAAASQRLNLITTELQEGVMKTRMQPIRNAWNKLPRVVRDLSISCGKQVEVVMEGAETELDKTILEAIKDPLTHIVRNSVDHGVESPEDRKAAGKPEVGTLRLRAYHEGGQVNVEISDDGGGINSDRIRAKAIEKELVTEQQVENMSDHELTNLILLPGFSTAEKVTNVSGRGVGMDVVKTNIEKIGGTLDIQSVRGQGTTLRIKIPLTLAIVPALIVSTGKENYAIPQVSLMELVRLEEGRAKNSIEFFHDTPVYRLRGDLLPLVYLDEQLEIRPPREWHERDESVNIVVLQAEDHQFGLVVDSINDTQEIVVKPLSNHLKKLSVYAGATIMGDGSVALILDTIGIARQSKVIAKSKEQLLADRQNRTETNGAQTMAVLIVDPGDETRIGIQLSSVSRLEEFSNELIEHSKNGPVVQYRDQILPLVTFSHACSVGTGAENEKVQTVVFTTPDGQDVGIVVGSIVDIVQENCSSTDFENGGQVIVQNRVTQIINLEEWVATNHPYLTQP